MNILDYPAWTNGEYCTVKDLKISVLDLGLIHSDATYDVLAVKNKVIQNLDSHLLRLQQSAHGWRLPIPISIKNLTTIIEKLIEQAEVDDLLVWIGLTRGIPSTGNPRDLANCKTNIFIYVKPYFGFNKQNSATVCLAQSVYRVPNDSINQLHKNFVWNDLTKAQWEAIDRGFDTAILTTRDGILTEGPGFNVGIITNDEIIAPSSNRLEGTVMNLVKQVCEKNEKKFVYRNIWITDILNADAMFLTSTAGNVIPVTKFENKIFEENGTLLWLMKNI